MTMMRRNGSTKRFAWVAALLLFAAALTVQASGDEPASPAARAEQLWKEGAGLHWEGSYRAAIDRYEEALRLAPSARTHTYLAWSLSALDRYPEAAAECRRALELDPAYPNAHNDLGSYLIELDRPAEAIPHLRRAAEIKGYCCPHYSYYQLGRAYLMQARVEDALQALGTALDLRPNYRAAMQLLTRIRAGRIKGL